MRHALKLREVERLRPFQSALVNIASFGWMRSGRSRLAQHHEDQARETPRIAGEQSRGAAQAEVAVEALPDSAM
jgi:hypothetical protein